MRAHRLLLTALALACTCAWAAPKRVPLEVMVNGQERPGIIGWMESGELWLSVQDAQALGLRNLAAPTSVAGKPSVRLNSLGAQASFDEAELRLSIVLDAKDIPDSTVVDFYAIRNQSVPVSVANGVLLDYEVGVGQAGRTTAFDAVTHLNASFAGWQLIDERAATLIEGQARHAGLRTTLRRDWPAQGLRLDFGTLDLPEPGLANWGVLRGVSFGSMNDGTSGANALRSATGLTTAVRYPGTAEVFVNGVRQGSFPVNPGTFDVQGLRGFSAGATNVRAVIRDIFGNESVVEESRYVGENTLRSGAQQFAYQLGQARFGAQGLQLRGTHRYGVSSTVTVTGKFEARSGYAAGQAGASVSLAAHGEVSGGVLFGRASGDPQPRGFFVAHQYSTQNWSSYTALEQRPQPALTAAGVFVVQDTQVLSTQQSWTTGSGNQFTARAAFSHFGDGRLVRDLEFGWSRKLAADVFMQALLRHNSQAGASGQVLLTWAPGTGIMANSFTSVDRAGATQQVTVAKLPNLGEAHWRMDLRESGGAQTLAGALEKDFGPGALKLSTSLSKDGSAARVAWRSGFMAGYGTSTVRSNLSNAAVVVDAQGLSGVGVFRNGMRVGATDSNGYFWLTDLPGYEEVRVSLDENSIPMNRWYSGGETRPVRPAPGAVVGVKFDIREVRAADVLLQVCEGCKPIADQPIYLNSEGGADTFGQLKAGRARVHGLLTGKHRVTTADGRCRGEAVVGSTGPVPVHMECKE